MALNGPAVASVVDADQDLTRDEAFRRLADRHLAAAYRLARAILHDHAEAEDATQDAFLRAWQKWSTLRDVTRFEHWFDRILVNTCRNRLRKEARARLHIPRAETGVADDPAQLTTRHAVIGAAFDTLDADHRIVIALRYFSDLTVDQIARRTGLRAGTVKSRLHYGLRRLHAAMDEAEVREVFR
jgi:RNA polymerase sigma-70 factor (ECF subfamily)